MIKKDISFCAHYELRLKKSDFSLSSKNKIFFSLNFDIYDGDNIQSNVDKFQSTTIIADTTANSNNLTKIIITN